MSEAPETIWVQWPQPNSTGLAFTCQARPPSLRHEYTLSTEVQRILDAARTAPQWDTAHDKLAPDAPHTELARLRAQVAADADLLMDAHKAMRVLHRVCGKAGLSAGAEAAKSISDRIAAALSAYRDVRGHE